jgi:molybdopterin-containing oxidoreductase family iron-sulfur binding subunit
MKPKSPPPNRPPFPPTYWKSLNDREPAPEFVEKLKHEFPEGADVLELGGVNRRQFLGLMGASMALASASLNSCVRKPVERILPYARRPEDLIPGKPKYFATTGQFGKEVVGLLVESHEGRPTKIEGNPRHPGSLGSTHAWAQASILDLYDPDRLKTPLHQGQPLDWLSLKSELSKWVGDWRQNRGNGLGILLPYYPSPSFDRLMTLLEVAHPLARRYFHDQSVSSQERQGLRALDLKADCVVPKLKASKVILSLDSDFLGTEGNVIANSRHFADGRRLNSETESMNRLYVVESRFSMTGAMADHRFRVSSRQVGVFLIHLVKALEKQGLSLGVGLTDPSWVGSLPETSLQGAQAVARDLLANKRNGLVMVGGRQPAWVHALALAVNTALENDGHTFGLRDESNFLRGDTLETLVGDIQKNKLEFLVILGGNPVFDAPGSLNLESEISKIKNVIHLTTVANETSVAAGWAIPEPHFLEHWGDFESADGTLSIQQPLISPLYPSWSKLEFLGEVLGLGHENGYAMVRKTWASTTGLGFEDTWRRALHEGVWGQSPSNASVSKIQGPQLISVLSRLSGLNWPGEQLSQLAESEGLELNLHLDASVLDGRYSNNAWLQELPDPMSKLTWDNAVLLNPSLARRLGLKDGDVVRLTVGERSLEIPAFQVPGTAENTLSVSVGYGRKIGSVAKDVGVNPFKLMGVSGSWVISGVHLEKTGKKIKMASTQDFGSMQPLPTFNERPLVREAYLAHFRENPSFVQADEVMPPEKIKSLWDEPNKRDGQQWGMSIDLNTCTGCNACTVACQSENNIPVVGKERVLDGREMHWIRLDRYFRGSAEDPQAVVQPVTCMQCETAPCEGVCPVAATTHSPDGLNDMAYNRCIGTRYCSNNCPFKVRRFNFFNYTKENKALNMLVDMQKNPDVTVRFRGVMEKCTYCVQRINTAKIESKVSGHGGHVEDGTVVPACAQACPTKAIVFGDINDPKSLVSVAKKQKRTYTMLAELNLKPRTSYLAKIRNPNPELI